MSDESAKNSWLCDTSPDARKVLIEGYRRMSPTEKMLQACELSRAVRQAALARIRRQYGEMSEREEKLRLASLWIDRETMIPSNWRHARHIKVSRHFPSISNETYRAQLLHNLFEPRVTPSVAMLAWLTGSGVLILQSLGYLYMTA